MLTFHSRMKRLENHIIIFKIVEALFMITALMAVTTFILGVSSETRENAIWLLAGSALQYITSVLLYRLRNIMKYGIKRYSTKMENKYHIDLECIRDEIGE